MAIASRIAMQIYFLNIGGDKAYQLVATKNFMSGNGFTINQVFASDLSAEQFLPLVGWPPGYPLLLSPFFGIFKGDYNSLSFFPERY
jgi:hypothetical protein